MPKTVAPPRRAKVVFRISAPEKELVAEACKLEGISESELGRRLFISSVRRLLQRHQSLARKTSV